MGYSVWHYRKTMDAKMVPIPHALADDFMHGKRPIPTKNHCVMLASIHVELDNRQLQKIVRVEFEKYETLPDGMIDPISREKYMKNAADFIPSLDMETEGVINAAHRFAKQKMERLYSWEPTEEDLDAIRDQIEARAK